MREQSRILAGLVGAAIAGQSLIALPAWGEEYALAPTERQAALHEPAAAGAPVGQPIALGTTAVTMASTGSAAIDWSDLTIPPATEDSYKTMEAGHLRENMSLSHMLLGGATLGLLGIAGISGIMLVQQNDPNIRLAHQVAVTSGTLAYLADGSLMLFAPRPFKTKGDTHISNIDYHRYLFYLHLAGMTSAVVTGLIATRFWGLDPSLDIRRTHPAIGGTAIGLIGLSATVMALNF